MKRAHLGFGLGTLNERQLFAGRWIDEEPIFYVVGGKYVPVLALLEAIPGAVLQKAIAQVERRGEVCRHVATSSLRRRA